MQRVTATLLIGLAGIGLFVMSQQGGWPGNSSANGPSTSIPELRFRVTTEFSIESNDEQVVAFRVEEGSKLVIGSLDQSALHHDVTLTVCTDLPEQHSTSILDQVEVHRLPAASVPTLGNGQSFPICPGHRFAMKQPDSVDGFPSQSHKSITRRFRTPFFAAATSMDRFLEGRLMAEGVRCRVFVEEHLMDDEKTAAPMTELAHALCHDGESGVLEYVESRLGPVEDVDGDGHVTLIVCNLTDGTQTSDEPVLGCVRGSDFRDNGPFGGDIVYLDAQLFGCSDRRAILAHELSHAAVFSAVVDVGCGDGIPCWLNEAIAHMIESEVHPESQNLNRRFSEFIRQTNAVPVILPDSAEYSPSRRGATRAAAYSFLTTTLSDFPDAEAITLLRSGSNSVSALESATGCRFSELFRSWAVRLVRSGTVMTQATLSDQKVSLRGTSFISLPAATQNCTVTLTCSRASEIQITVLK